MLELGRKCWAIGRGFARSPASNRLFLTNRISCLPCLFDVFFVPTFYEFMKVSVLEVNTNKLYNIFMISACLVRCFVVRCPVGLTAAPVFTPRDTHADASAAREKCQQPVKRATRMKTCAFDSPTEIESVYLSVASVTSRPSSPV